MSDSCPEHTTEKLTTPDSTARGGGGGADSIISVGANKQYTAPDTGWEGAYQSGSFLFLGNHVSSILQFFKVTKMSL